MNLKYIGHSAFEIIVGEKTILIDPLVSSNPDYDWRSVNIADIFLTHAHFDHLGEAITIAKEKKAKITAVYELAKYCEAQGCEVNAINLGGWLEYDWGRAVFVPAFHSSSLPDGSYGGCAAGIVFDVETMRIYHAGDTCLTGEMKTIKELYRPNVALLPIGGTFTMDAEHAAIAANWLGAQTVLPMHMSDDANGDIETFAKLVQANNTVCVVINTDMPKEENQDN